MIAVTTAIAATESATRQLNAIIQGLTAAHEPFELAP